MDDYRWNNYNHNHNHNQVPAFGSWDYGYDLPYTQCFESARQVAGLVRYGGYNQSEERDLYVAGDLYQNDVVTPAVIVVPRRRRKGGIGYPEGKKQQRRQKQEWGYSEDHEIVKEPPSPVSVLSPQTQPPRRPAAAHKSKPIDEDLYKIPPEFLHAKPKRKRGLGLFSSCLLPGCV